VAEEAIEVKGWPQLAQGSAQLASSIEHSADENLAGTAAAVAGQVAGSVPVVSGTLAGSVTASPGPPASVGIGDGVPYAGWIEFGGTRGRPYVGTGRYLFPGVQASEPMVVAAVQAATETEIKGMTWPTPST
jgi:phage gpG-like protein